MKRAALMASFTGRLAWFCLVALSLCHPVLSTQEQIPEPSAHWLSVCHQTDQGLNCSAQALDDFHGTIPEFVTALDLSDNSMMGDEVLPYGENLRSLSLRNNRLTGEMTWRIDERMPLLEKLDLSGNELTKYPSHLPLHLKKVDLSRNGIESVVDVILIGDLREVFLNDNRISGIVDLCTSTPQIIAECTAAQTLSKLDLSKNCITGVKDKGFSALVGLQVLSLASNSLKSLNKMSFQGLKNLQFLDISDNDLSSVHDRTFERLTNLKYLYLRGNLLLAIPSKLPLLEWFDVSYNNIKRVNETMKTSLYPIEMVNMGHNPFHCDCHILWLKEWYDRREYILDYSVDIPPDEYIPSCGSPDHLAGDHWDVLADQVFVCAPEEAKNPPLERTPSPGIDHEDDEELNSAGDTEKYVAAYDLHVQVRSVHPTMIKLEWRAPSHYTNLLIQYFKAAEEEETTLFAQIQATQGHHALKNLDPASSYIICVLPKAEALAPLSDINDCLTVHTLPGDMGARDNSLTGGFHWFRIDHTMESRFKMIFGCFTVSVVIVACGLLLAEGIMRLCAEKEKEHSE